MAEEDRLDRFVEDARAFVEMRPAPDVTPVVMRRINDAEGPPTHQPSPAWAGRVLRTLWTPRRLVFDIRPAYAVVAAAAVIFAVSIAPARPTRDPVTVATAEVANEKVLVQFRLQSSDASDVRLAGSFTNWRPEYELHQTAPGMWTITLPLSPGVHDYAFVIDGKRWVTDPFALAVQDGFGGTNSRLTLVGDGSDQRL
jgi:hypothetical protein